MFFHRHCHAWVRVSSDEIALMCAHCFNLGVDDPKVLGEWFEIEGDDRRLAQSQAAFKKAHANGCPQNDFRTVEQRRPKPRARDFDWGA